MYTVKALHKEFEIVRNINETCSEALYKGKRFFLRKLNIYNDEGKIVSYAFKKLSNTGVKVPKFYGYDKKTGYLVTQYIEGESLAEKLSKEDLGDEVFEQLFKNAYLAKMNKITLDYYPHNWMFSNGVLYYMAPSYIPYDEKKDLALCCLPLYFNTQELKNYMEENGIFYDKSRIKNAFETNKQMALTTCKYYR